MRIIDVKGTLIINIICDKRNIRERINDMRDIKLGLGLKIRVRVRLLTGISSRF